MTQELCCKYFWLNDLMLICLSFSLLQDVVKGNQRLNMAYVAHLFNTYPALKPVEEGLDDFDLGDFEETREEKSE